MYTINLQETNEVCCLQFVKESSVKINSKRIASFSALNEHVSFNSFPGIHPFIPQSCTPVRVVQACGEVGPMTEQAGLEAKYSLDRSLAYSRLLERRLQPIVEAHTDRNCQIDR